ncbi:hypothetical protein PIROE2DRAFT_1239 [Piromyces sp. E2]|nr:hypothetical protein PIROE2DRAFT_1239 [Piromyces sp. E2]|eukprot:OUM70688.1 hypothetical protein PIROE2DRAFT_1239 [Piromyces sp. E2]
MVNDLDTPFEVFKVLKQEYDKNETKDAQQWIEKLKKLKAKNPSECSDVLRKIKEIFKILDKKGYKTGHLEKLRFIHFAMLTIIQSVLKFRGNETLDDAIEMANNFTTVREYYAKGKGIVFEKKEKPNPDMMDIDYIGKSENNSYNKEISFMNNNKTSNFKSRNLEYESNSSKDDISFEDIKPMFEKGVENIEMYEVTNNKEDSVNIIEAPQNENSDQDDKEDEITIWTYDTGCPLITTTSF